MDKVNKLVSKLYKAIRKSGNYSNEWDLPYFELVYHPAKGWGLFMKRDGMRNTPDELFYKVYTSAEDAFLENIAFYEGR